ncbi:Cysteine synthase 2 [Microbotryomycetes sp. JL201]|nr:Cysteine synthase 2 [Microbotryomycetes sp. JL201]
MFAQLVQQPRPRKSVLPTKLAASNWLSWPSWLRPTRIGQRNSVLLGLTLGISFTLSATGLALFLAEQWRRRIQKKQGDQRVIEIKSEEVAGGVEGLIGNTPIVRINSLSDTLGVEILGKCEFLNPFGSVKDRVALKIIQQAEDAGLIHPDTGSCIFEGTSGSTGISIAGIARAKGYKAHIVLSDDVAKEKVQLLEALGAEVERVRPVSIVDKRHYVNLARVRAQQFGQQTVLSKRDGGDATPSVGTRSGTATPSDATMLVTSQQEPESETYIDPAHGLFSDQFENLSNMLAHEQGTAPEIWVQTKGEVDAFVSGAGTGGTIAGVGKYLKAQKPQVEIVLSDPQGSGLFHKIHDGVMYSETESEGKRRRHQVDTVVEGIGLNRLTRNFSQALPIIDDAFRVTDEEAVAMARHLAREDGLFLGSSSAVNLVACVRLAQKWGSAGQGRTILTKEGFACSDSGSRHHSRFWNDEYLRDNGIAVKPTIDHILPFSTVKRKRRASTSGVLNDLPPLPQTLA